VSISVQEWRRQRPLSIVQGQDLVTGLFAYQRPLGGCEPVDALTKIG
jgi:hypothetical protein